MPPYISSSDLIALQRTRATIRHMMATNSATTGSLAIAPVRQGPRHAHASPERFLCSHRPEIQCLLSELQKCCACSDQRPHSAVYDIYVDGDGYVPQGYRWSYYCSSCREFWRKQLDLWDILASQTRIPEYPAIQHISTSTSPPAATHSSSRPRMNTSRPGLPSSSRRRSEGLSSSNRSSRVADNNCDDDGQPSRPVRRPQILQSTSANATSQSTTRETNATILAHHMRQPRGEIRESTNSVRRSTISELPPVLRGPETRTRNETATTRFQPEEARAQIVNLEQQLERLQERLLQNRFLEGPVWGAGTENGQSGTTPRTPVTVTNPFDRQLNAAPTTGLRLSSESASGSSHNSMSGGAEERLRALHQLTYMDVDPSPAARRLAILEDARGLDGMRNTTRRRRSATARAAVGGSLTNADMPRRLWRLQDSSRESAQQIDSELESLHDTASRRYNNSAVEREHDRERLRQVWGDIESDDYVSPLTSLFQTSWEEYFRREGRLPQDRARPEVDGENDRLPFPLALALTDDDTEIEESRNLSQFIPPPLGRYHPFPRSESAARMARMPNALETNPLSPQQDVSFATARRRVADLRDLRAQTAAFLAQPAPSVSQGPRLDDHKERPPPLEPDNMKLDCECKVCFGQIADTLLLPCSHLVLCEWCADQLGAQSKEVYTLNRPNCPVCRKIVMDRVKVFRG